MRKLIKSLAIILPLLVLTSCSSDDDNNINVITPIPITTVYDLGPVSDPGISGSATVFNNLNGTVTVEIQLNGTPSGGMHPAHIHFNTAAEGGDIAVSLTAVNGDTGFSSTTFSELDNGNAIDYAGILAFDGYINVHLSSSDLATLVAQGDIGQNDLTGTEKTYALGTVDVDGISGTATFSERVNGEALAVIMLNGTPDGGMHPAHIHMNTAVEGGGIAYTFIPIDGNTGMSVNNLSVLDFGDDDPSNDEPFSYNMLLQYDGYINVHLSSDDLATLVAQGDIGQNELTGTSVAYNLSTVAVPGISGTITFEERNNGEALATIDLDGTPDGGMHPAHIHMGSVETAPGDILFAFNPVDGTTGMSMTNVSILEDQTNFNYQDVLDVDGYVNVHLSESELGVIVAQGNIGSNN